MKCICDQFWTPCSQSSTQEDLLCDQCREHPAHGFTGDGLLSMGMEVAETPISVTVRVVADRR